MCVAVPGEVIEIHGTKAKIRVHKAVIEAESALVDTIATGDMVLVHAGFIIEKLGEEESNEMIDSLMAYSNILESWGEEP